VLQRRRTVDFREDFWYNAGMFVKKLKSSSGVDRADVGLHYNGLPDEPHGNGSSDSPGQVRKHALTFIFKQVRAGLKALWRLPVNVTNVVRGSFDYVVNDPFIKAATLPIRASTKETVRFYGTALKSLPLVGPAAKRSSSRLQERRAKRTNESASDRVLDALRYSIDVIEQAAMEAYVRTPRRLIGHLVAPVVRPMDTLTRMDSGVPPEFLRRRSGLPTVFAEDFFSLPADEDGIVDFRGYIERASGDRNFMDVQSAEIVVGQEGDDGSQEGWGQDSDNTVSIQAFGTVTGAQTSGTPEQEASRVNSYTLMITLPEHLVESGGDSIIVLETPFNPNGAPLAREKAHSLLRIVLVYIKAGHSLAELKTRFEGEARYINNLSSHDILRRYVDHLTITLSKPDYYSASVNDDITPTSTSTAPPVGAFIALPNPDTRSDHEVEFAQDGDVAEAEFEPVERSVNVSSEEQPFV
jgi:hypothetical protein